MTWRFDAYSEDYSTCSVCRLRDKADKRDTGGGILAHMDRAICEEWAPKVSASRGETNDRDTSERSSGGAGFRRVSGVSSNGRKALPNRADGGD